MTQERENSRGFVGAQPLMTEQLKLTLPNYDSILQQIEEMRKEAHNINQAGSTGKFNLRKYNHVFGIFGPRGTGKSSALYSLMSFLAEKSTGNVWYKESNMVLKPIEPDNYGQNTKILGAILGSLKEVVDELCSEIKHQVKESSFEPFFKNCVYIEKNPLEQAFAEAMEYYCYTEDEYRKILTNNFTDMENYKRKYSHVLNPDVQLTEKINLLIDELVKWKRFLTKARSGSNSSETAVENTPMVFIIIDDIDLKTTKTKELIDSIMHYTCHPNVVCLLSGDYDLLKEAITLSLIGSEPINDYQLLNDSNIFGNGKSVISRKHDLANEYLKKIIPPLYRKNLVLWTPIAAMFFSTDSGASKKYFYEMLSQSFRDPSMFFLNEKPSLAMPSESLKLNEYLFSVFDNTARGLINIYYVLSNISTMNSKSEVMSQEERFYALKTLIETIVNASSTLVKYQQEIFEKYIFWSPTEHTVILDYATWNYSVEEMLALSTSHFIKEDLEKLKNILALMNLAFEFAKIPEDEVTNSNVNANLLMIMSYLYMSENGKDEVEWTLVTQKTGKSLAMVTNQERVNNLYLLMAEACNTIDLAYFVGFMKNELKSSLRQRRITSTGFLCSEPEEGDIFAQISFKVLHDLLLTNRTKGKKLLNNLIDKKYNGHKMAIELVNSMKALSSYVENESFIVDNYPYLTNLVDPKKLIRLQELYYSGKINLDYSRTNFQYSKDLLVKYYDQKVVKGELVAYQEPSGVMVKNLWALLMLNRFAKNDFILEDEIMPIEDNEITLTGISSEADWLKDKLNSESLEVVTGVFKNKKEEQDYLRSFVRELRSIERLNERIHVLYSELSKTDITSKPDALAQMIKEFNRMEGQFNTLLLKWLRIYFDSFVYNTGSLYMMPFRIHMGDFREQFLKEENGFYMPLKDGTSHTNYKKARDRINMILTDQTEDGSLYFEGFNEIMAVLNRHYSSTSWYGTQQAYLFSQKLRNTAMADSEILELFLPTLQLCHQIKHQLGLLITNAKNEVQKKELMEFILSCETEYQQNAINQMQQIGIEEMFEEAIEEA